MGLTDSFVPAADETWRLQRGSDPECRFFQSFADQGHYQSEGTTRQGIYTVTPSGMLLGSINDLNPRDVEELLVASLAKWETLDDSYKSMPPESELAPDHRWEDSFPEDGLILRTYSRDLPADGNPNAEPSLRWNRDHAWFTKKEMHMWLPDNPKVGDEHAVPQILINRIARFHLVDNVNGQTEPYAASEVRGSQLTVTITKIDGPMISLHIDGETLTDTDGTWRMTDIEFRPNRRRPHGLRAKITGEATFDTDQAAFTSFEMLALGTRWGRTQYNGRRRARSTTPIGITFELAPATPAGRVGPAFAGPEYAEWVELPTGMRRR